MTFQVAPLAAGDFAHLYGRSDAALRADGIHACVADTPAGFPCRVSLADARPGERLLLLNYEHQPADTPYRSRHAIFVRDGGVEARPEVGEVPAMLATRLLSVRGFNAGDMMIDAEMVEGIGAASAFRTLFADPATAYLHVHTARRGCYLARVNRG